MITALDTTQEGSRWVTRPLWASERALGEKGYAQDLEHLDEVAAEPDKAPKRESEGRGNDCEETSHKVVSLDQEESVIAEGFEDNPLSWIRNKQTDSTWQALLEGTTREF